MKVENLTEEQKRYYKYLHKFFDKIEDLTIRTAGSKKLGKIGSLESKIIDKIDFEKLYTVDKKYSELLKKQILNYIKKNIIEEAGIIGEDRATALVNLFEDKN